MFIVPTWAVPKVRGQQTKSETIDQGGIHHFEITNCDIKFGMVWSENKSLNLIRLHPAPAGLRRGTAGSRVGPVPTFSRQPLLLP
jgi:hypothetical protein